MAEVKRQAVVGKREGKLELAQVIAWLVAEGMLRAEDAATIRPVRADKDSADGHPLAVISARGLSSAKPPHKALSMDALAMWIAQRAGLPFHRIDPLKVDVTAVTGVMS